MCLICAAGPLHCKDIVQRIVSEFEKSRAISHSLSLSSSSTLTPSDISRLLRWKASHQIGSGLRTIGHTTFVSASLQSLSYLPPITFLSLSQYHSAKCKSTQFCCFCAFESHVRACLFDPKVRTTVPTCAVFVNHLKLIHPLLRSDIECDPLEFLENIFDRMRKDDGNMN